MIFLIRMAFMRRGVLTNNALRKYGPFAIPITAYLFAKFLSDKFGEDHRSYHNRSALFGGRDLKPGERIW